MDSEEQIRRNTIMQNRLRHYDVTHWAIGFLRELLSIVPAGAGSAAHDFTEADRAKVIEDYGRSSHRLLILDYDGTLVPFSIDPEMARPGPKLLKILGPLADDPGNMLVLATGRPRKTLDQWFGALPIGFAAEHGAWVKDIGGPWTLIRALDTDWMERVLPILQTYADRVPGAFVEEKEFSLVWHYRAADPDLGRGASRELTDYLLAFTANLDVQVLRGSKVIELRTLSVNKGAAVQQWLARTEFDFVLAIGDDWTDEDIFTVLPESAYSFRVGSASRTHARYRLRDPQIVIDILAQLAGKRDGADGSRKPSAALQVP
jgi:trehalose 6-phosphate synthase/phosphatase